MKATKNPLLKIAILAALFSGAGIMEADAQLNEKRIKRDATGIYRGKTSGVTRKRPGEFYRLAGATGKLRFPVRSNSPKTSVRDNELDGVGRGKFKGREKKSKVRRGGNLIAYLAKGNFDILGDGHNRYAGTIGGPIKDRGSKWMAETKQNATRRDNDGHTSRFKSKAKGKH